MSQLSVMNQESGENRGAHPNIKKNRSHDQHNLMPFGLGELFWSSTIPKYIDDSAKRLKSAEALYFSACSLFLTRACRYIFVACRQGEGEQR